MFISRTLISFVTSCFVLIFAGACHEAPAHLLPEFSTLNEVTPSAQDLAPLERSLSRRAWKNDGWYGEDALTQGFLGIALFDQIERVERGGDVVDGSSDAIAAQPVAGGGFQFRTGESFGFEVMFGVSGRQNEPLRLGLSGGGSQPVEVDLLLVDLYGGPVLRSPLVDRWNLIGAAGPLLQFAQWDEKGTAGDADSKGFGLGAYARIGVEYEGRGIDRVGLSLRWSDVDVGLGDGRGDLSLEGLQLVFTLTRAF